MSDNKIPDDFFDKLPDRIINRISKEKHTQELFSYSKTLSELKRKNPYKVPLNYFEQLAERRIVNPRVIRKWTMVTSIAASFLIMILMVTGTGSESNKTMISDADIIDYYAENVQDIESDLLSELIVVEEEATIEDYILEEMISELSDEELELLSQNL